MAAMKAKTLLLPILLLGLAFAGRICEAQLRTNFYKSTCPQVETIVRNVVRQKFQQTFVTVPGVLRLFFHDCFVDGCDGSVIIASTPTNKAEKDYTDNLSLAGDGFDTVMKAKGAVEAACPGRVSCADILALATREVVGLAKGPYYAVELGRRDGRISMASQCPGNLPTPSSNVDGLMALFSRKGLNLTDLVALSGGGHTLGFAHCTKITERLYGSGGPDPTLNSSYVSQLQAECPRNVDPTIAINQDPITPRIFDNVYYKNLQKSMGLFKSDQVLYNDPRTRALVNAFAANPAAFQAAFVNSITKLGRVGVKTGRHGEIHRDCSRIN